ncbi:TPA: efflux RND transporter periplasmic adaptor subunit, partial [Enterobacter hormaechei subsp. steigerwaltii]|nr:efflux RND transporter periplasmic adaptor subunit [Enterobacter hormaechei subsp. steigerwaltii]
MKFPLLFALLTCTLPPAFAAAIPVRVATVEQTAHAAERQIPGRIEAIHTVELRARTEGVITRIHFRDGQYVKKGDVLFELDDAEPRAALRLAQAEVRSAEATLRQAQQQLSRFESLGSSNAISRHDVDNARMQRDV